MLIKCNFTSGYKNIAKDYEVFVLENLQNPKLEIKTLSDTYCIEFSIKVPNLKKGVDSLLDFFTDKGWGCDHLVISKCEKPYAYEIEVMNDHW